MLNQTFDVREIDLEGFRKELDELGIRTKASVGEKEFKHVRKMNIIMRVLYFAGLAMAWMWINPLSMFLIGLAKSSRWTMLGHFIIHRAYDKIPNIPKRYTSKVFAKGWRRYIDWHDWMLPGAWEFEHNYLHHYHVGEMGDPDFPQKNVHTIRTAKIPKWMKYIYAFILMATWRFVYYAPNTLFYLEMKKKSNEAVDSAMKFEESYQKSFPGARIYSPFSELGSKYWMRCLLPYGLVNFVLIPLAFFPLGSQAMLFVLINMLGAELFTNVHTFMTVVTNHAGDDVPYFESRVESKAEYYLRQVIGSVNYNSGNEWIDTLHGYSNYQIEHHLWPDVPMNKYREIQPEVEAICKKYNVPYIKESVWVRTKKLVDIMIGKTHMRPVETKPSKVTGAPAANPSVQM